MTWVAHLLPIVEEPGRKTIHIATTKTPKRKSSMFSQNYLYLAHDNMQKTSTPKIPRLNAVVTPEASIQSKCQRLKKLQ